jgi:hypothetical protein
MELKPPPGLTPGETLTGAEIVIRSLAAEGVEFVFGYPGGAVLHIYDAIFRQKDVKHILVRHEQGAIHAADGYARARNGPGVCAAQPIGASNLASGLRDAFMARSPVIAISGGPAVASRYRHAYQEVEDFHQFDGVTKANADMTKLYNDGFAKGLSDAMKLTAADGQSRGSVDGRNAGYPIGYNDVNQGYPKGYADGKAVGIIDGRNSVTAAVEGSQDGRSDGEADGRASGRTDGFSDGYNDGYEAGLDDGRDRRRFDPVSESRYRSATRGYERQYGSQDRYKANYRTAFREGYEEGYADGGRYNRR